MTELITKMKGNTSNSNTNIETAKHIFILYLTQKRSSKSGLLYVPAVFKYVLISFKWRGT
jgi:hypothetical protein